MEFGNGHLMAFLAMAIGGTLPMDISMAFLCKAIGGTLPMGI
jgi:hypothetical protein